MTTELGQTAPQAEDAAPRHRGAHAAAKSGLLGRRPKNVAGPPSPSPSPRAAPSARAAPSPAPVPRQPSVRPATSPPRPEGPRQEPPRPAVPRPVPPTAAAQDAANTPGPLRSAFADVAAALVVLAVVPLALLQVPDAIEWAVPARFASAAALTSLLRASGLALTAMAIAAPLGGLAVRRFRAWPVLMAGLGVFGVADIMGGAVRTIAQVGIDRSLHGAAAGFVIIAAAALAAERAGSAHRALAGWLAACAVAGLAAASEVMRLRLSGGDWHDALRPYPWLTGAALGLTALYAMLAEGTLTGRTRTSFPAAERARLALLVVPIAGMCAMAIAVTYGRGDDGVIAAALACAISLCGLAVMTGRAGTAGWCAVVCPVVGFTVMPAAGAASDLLRVSPHSGLQLAAALSTATVAGAMLAAALPARFGGLLIACGLALAAAGYGASFATGLTGTTGPRGQLFAVACVPLAGGLAMALAAAFRGTGVAGAMCGVVLMLAGVLTGYLADGAIELRAVATADRDAATVRASLLTADARWDIIAATICAGVALAAFARMLGRLTSTEVDQ